jgi:hypothetical protein|tara:strand:- start:198 stop:413 length:216 start_codon:yes stop_codon:yes gene_type:complete
MNTIGSGFDDNNLILRPNGNGTVTVTGNAPVTLTYETLIKELTSLAETEGAKEIPLFLPLSHQAPYNRLAG